MKSVVLRCALLALFGLIVGCSGDPNLVSTLGDTSVSDAGDSSPPDTVQDTGGDTGGDTGPVDECIQTTPQEAATFATDYVTALCERAFACEQNPEVAAFFTFGGWETVDDCISTRQAGYMSPEQAQQAASGGSLALNSCNSGPCLEQIPNLDCLEIHRQFSQSPADFPIEECKGAYAGNLAEGQNCTTSAQCSGLSFFNDTATTETCTGRCQPAGQAEAQCGNIVCRFDQYCETQNNVCMSRLSVGDSCTESYECPIDAYCSDSGTCTEVQSGLNAGQNCDFSEKLCGAGLFCKDGLDIVCSEFKSPGEDCDTFSCAGQYYCSGDSDTCVELKDGGASCMFGQECKSGRCKGGNCNPVATLCQ